MACPTCDHTMQGIAAGWFWCPRCGTLELRQRDADAVIKTSRPKLVDRCRAFEAGLFGPADRPEEAGVRTDWRRLGVAESINPPGDRP